MSTLKRAHSVVILTGRFGMGHCAAAEAIRQDIIAHDPAAGVRVVDVMDYLFPEMSKGIYDSFDFLVRRFSWVYNLVNRAAGAKTGAPLQGAAVKKLDTLLAGVDLVIATLPVCSSYISAYKSLRRSDIPLYTYVTDVTVHPEWIAEGTDLYFVAAPSSRETLIANGVAPSKIVISGVPVRQHFLAQNICVPRTKKQVLIMGGGLGLIPEADALLDALSKRIDVHVTLIAGKNKQLANRVRRDYPTVETVGYTDKVHEYMRRADLMITKSGGLTTFEAMYCEVPLYILRPFLMQEVGNARFIEQLGIGWVDWQRNADVSVHDVKCLLADDALRARMRQNMRAARARWQSFSPLGYYEQAEQARLSARCG